MDKAQQQGLTVMLGLWMKPEHEGFDYFDSKAIARQKEALKQEVLRFRDHPALLMWNVGNELDLHTHNPRSFQALKDVVDMIHELDPYHPVTTTLSGNYKDHMANVLRFCPDIDILTINVFGPLSELSTQLRAYGWNRPYLVGEFGGRGWWEAPRTTWDAPIDQSSSAKAEYIRPRFEKTIVGDSTHCLGSYIMYWGQRFEQTSMWFSLFTATGEKTAVVDMMYYLWTGKEMPNKAPRLTQLLMAGREAKSNLVLEPGETIPATLAASDPEGDPLRVQWEVVKDVDEWNTLPQDRTPGEPIKKAIAKADGLMATVQAPTKSGPYRLMVIVYDGQGSVATHSYPFRVGPIPAITVKRDEQLR